MQMRVQIFSSIGLQMVTQKRTDRGIFVPPGLTPHRIHIHLSFFSVRLGRFISNSSPLQPPPLTHHPRPHLTRNWFAPSVTLLRTGKSPKLLFRQEYGNTLAREAFRLAPQKLVPLSKQTLVLSSSCSNLNCLELVAESQFLSVRYCNVPHTDNDVHRFGCFVRDSTVCVLCVPK